MHWFYQYMNTSIHHIFINLNWHVWNESRSCNQVEIYTMFMVNLIPTTQNKFYCWKLCAQLTDTAKIMSCIPLFYRHYLSIFFLDSISLFGSNGFFSASENLSVFLDISVWTYVYHWQLWRIIKTKIISIL